MRITTEENFFFSSIFTGLSWEVISKNMWNYLCVISLYIFLSVWCWFGFVIIFFTSLYSYFNFFMCANTSHLVIWSKWMKRFTLIQSQHTQSDKYQFFFCISSLILKLTSKFTQIYVGCNNGRLQFLLLKNLKNAACWRASEDYTTTKNNNNNNNNANVKIQLRLGYL